MRLPPSRVYYGQVSSIPPFESPVFPKPGPEIKYVVRDRVCHRIRFYRQLEQKEELAAVESSGCLPVNDIGILVQVRALAHICDNRYADIGFVAGSGFSGAIRIFGR